MKRDLFILSEMNIPTRVFDLRSGADGSQIDWNAPQTAENINAAAGLLACGKTVAFPTETVYGLGANALDEDAVNKIFQAKGRPSDNPLIVHIARMEMLPLLAEDIPQKALLLMDAFWPGPLSIILKRKPVVPDRVTAGLDTVAIRMPSNEEARRLIDASGCPIAAPSANLSGKPSPTKAEHILHDLLGRADGLLLGRDCAVGLESTVIDMTAVPPVILRPGAVTKKQIEGCIGPVLQQGKTSPGSPASVPLDRQPNPPAKDSVLSPGKSAAPRAPGMKYTHYAPDAPLHLIEGPPSAAARRIAALANESLLQGKTVGIIASEETMEEYGRKLSLSCKKLLLVCAGNRNKPDGIACRLFGLLREFDRQKADIIFSESFQGEGIGEAIMNRLEKAADTIEEVCL